MQNRNPNSTFGIDINEYTQDVNFTTLARTVDFLYLRASGSATGRFRVDRRFLEFARKLEILEYLLVHTTMLYLPMI